MSGGGGGGGGIKLGGATKKLCSICPTQTKMKDLQASEVQ
jgi:hypothetical protein